LPLQSFSLIECSSYPFDLSLLVIRKFIRRRVRKEHKQTPTDCIPEGNHCLNGWITV